MVALKLLSQVVGQEAADCSDINCQQLNSQIIIDYISRVLFLGETILYCYALNQLKSLRDTGKNLGNDKLVELLLIIKVEAVIILTGLFNTLGTDFWIKK